MASGAGASHGEKSEKERVSGLQTHVSRWVIAKHDRYWVKLAATGEPVGPVEPSAERKPWEPLVLGVACDDDDDASNEADDADSSRAGLLERFLRSTATAPPCPWKRAAHPTGAAPETESESESEPSRLKRVAKALAFCSVPDAEHSRKPRLDALLEDCFDAFDGPKLELFGRGAELGWLVAGDQALAFEAEP